GDDGLLSAALINLHRNAIQAAPRGSAVAIRGSREKDRYRVEVRDEGPGIPSNLQERVFEPFFSTREKGTGLGLPLARKILQAHGGDLHLSSRPGETVFRAELPLPAEGPSGAHGLY